jgi:hypothetical protein
MNENVHRGIVFEGKTSRKKMEFLDTMTSIEKDKNNELKLITGMYSKPTDTHQYLSPKSCHPKENTKSIPYGVAHRIRLNCSDEKFLDQAVKYKAYLMKSGYRSADIDDQFSKIAQKRRKDLLMDKPKKKKQPHEINIRYISNYEPKFPSIRAALRTIEPELENDDLLCKMFPKGVKNMQVSYRARARTLKKCLQLQRSMDRTEEI